MRFNLNLRFGTVTLYFMLSHTQRLKGITSKLNKSQDRHVVLWDLEETQQIRAYAQYQQRKQNKPIHEIVYDCIRQELEQLQRIWKLSNIYVVSDKPESSWRALCFDVFRFRDFLQILLQTKTCDYSYIWWTMKRGEATHRISQKKGRMKQKLFDVIESYYKPIPPEFPAKIVNYETGIEKKGLWLTNAR